MAASRGELVIGAGNKPIALNDSQAAWYVEEGGLDVFFMERGRNGPVSGAEHVLRAMPGQLVFGFGDGIVPLTPFGKGLPGSRFRRLQLSELAEQASGEELDWQVEQWVAAVGAAVASRIRPRPRATLLLDAQEQRTGSSGMVASTRPGVLLWAAAEPGSVLYLGTEAPADDSARYIPLSQDTWLTVHAETLLEVRATRELRQQGQLLGALEAFQQLALATEFLNQRLLLADAVNAQTALATHRRGDEYNARRSLFGVLRPADAISETAGSELIAALNIIGRHESIAFIAPAGRSADSIPTLTEIMESSGARSRKVRLASEDRWWLGDSGAMLGFRQEDGRPVALLPSVRGRYRAVDPTSGKSEAVNARSAMEFSEDAWVFYRSLPDDRIIDNRALLRFAAKSALADIWRLALAGIAANFLTLAPGHRTGRPRQFRAAFGQSRVPVAGDDWPHRFFLPAAGHAHPARNRGHAGRRPGDRADFGCALGQGSRTASQLLQAVHGGRVGRPHFRVPSSPRPIVRRCRQCPAVVHILCANAAHTGFCTMPGWHGLPLA